MAGDGTTSDPLFNNDLRRPRSATERLRKEDGGDPGGGVVTNVSESPPATSAAAASNNRPLSSATDFFPKKAHVSDALRTTLARLDASDLTLVYEKHMETSDRSKGQNRLLMSCKCETKRAAFASIFTGTEMPLVHRPEPLKAQEDEEHGSNDVHDDDDEQGKQRSMVAQGLAVEAYDCDGRSYKLNLKYLSSNTAYRIIGPEWTVFLENNGLLVAGGGGGGVTTRKPPSGRRQKKRRSHSLPDAEEPPPNDEHQLAVRDAAGDVRMELWAFRSPKLSVGVKEQPGGALGLLLLLCSTVVAVEARQGRRKCGRLRRHNPRHNSHGHGGDATGKLGDDAAPRSTTRYRPLGPVERLLAEWLSYYDRSDDADVNGSGKPDAKQGPK